MGPEVETRYGRVRGTEKRGISIFRGIRFAAAPAGPRRFQPPQPPEAWTGVRDATRPGPAAPQFALPVFGWISAAGSAPGDDCLSVNVWTPATDGARRPVMVWIHGGGFLVGAGSTAVYDGLNLARRGDVVVVTINYRLGALGYAHLRLLLGEEFAESSNLGVRDQIAALEWIRDNIDRFGGDPANVTLFGQSAGAMSIGALLGAPRARTLFHRAICQSGAADHVLSEEDAERVARTFVRRLGGPHPSQEAFGRIPMGHILRAQRQAMMELTNAKNMMVFLPVVDGDVIPEQPLDAVRAGRTEGIPLLIGATLDEWRLFRLLEEGPFGLSEQDLLARFEDALASAFQNPPNPRTAVRQFRTALASRGARTRPGDVWTSFQTARVMHFPAARLAEAQRAGGGSAHHYLFTWRPPAVRRALGACHGLDIPFVFGSMQHPLALSFGGVTASAARLSRKMQSSWIRFAREGSPAHERLPPWEQYCQKHRTTMVFGRRCSTDQAPLERERRLLERWSSATA